MGIFISVKEVAQILGVSRFHVYYLMDTGVLPYVRPYGMKRKILRKDFEAWIRSLEEESRKSTRKGEPSNGAHT
jgi:excisionase family DNA binding protein